MRAETAKAPKAIAFEVAYPGTISAPCQMRADLSAIACGFPALDDLLLLTSELASNAILHSRSGAACGTFTVRATLYPSEYAWVEVIDQGGAWRTSTDDEEHGRGLVVVDAIAGSGNWGIDGDEALRVAWFRLDWADS